MSLMLIRPLTVAAALFQQPPEAPPTPVGGDVAAKLAAYIEAAAEVHDFSGAVIVSQGDETLYEGGFGFANREHGVPNRPETKFRLGSITKQFTAMAVLILQDRGQLDVDHPIGQYLEDAPGAWEDITIHHLLTHTSGIPNYTEFPEMMEKTARLPATVDEVMASFRDKPLDFEPGEKFAYSNSGYIVLGKIIEEASGQDYEALLREAIFEPLGMDDTGYDRQGTILPGRASGYRRTGKGYENAPYLDMIWPHAAGALYSTVRDMARWDRALRAGELISPESYEAMYTPFKDDYAYGWAIGERGGRRTIRHGGGIHGFQSIIVRVPDEGLCVVVLSNVVPSRVEHIARDLVGVALGEEVELPKKPEVAEIDPAGFDALAGRYRLPSGRTVTFRREGDRYFARMEGQDELEIWPTSDTEYFLKAVEARLTFVRGEGGRATHVILHQGGRDAEAERIDEEDEAHDETEDRPDRG